jgi:hypothetical protein
MLKGKRISRKGLSFSFLVLSTIFTAILIFISAPSRAIAGPVTESTAAAPTPATSYQLAPTSNFNRGCFGPCLCPVLIAGELTGSFELAPLKPTKLFTRYSVTNVSWDVIDSQGIVVHKISGNGIYEIGKGVPLMQQMTLFLSIDGEQPVTFDSGLVPEQTPFPDISISIFNGTCFGSWMTINAIPK